MKKLIFVLMMLIVTQNIKAQQTIIPEPVYYQATEQRLELQGELIIQVNSDNDELVRHASEFQHFLQSIDVGNKLPTQKNPPRHTKKPRRSGVF